MLSSPIGATFTPDSTTFRVWAPDRRRVDVVLEGTGSVPMTRCRGGYYSATFSGLSPGTLYWFRLDGEGPFPDPASRFQPRGVHGPSMVVDPAQYVWNSQPFPGVSLSDLVLYELHVGAFTEEGTFRAAAEKLDYLRELGITAVELMPIADFPGRWNWGYDGVAPFAPARCYGTPDDLRAFVDRAHELGIAVLLDVVYNHFGPDGAYQGLFSRSYFSKRHRNAWGDGLHFDGRNSAAVREYFVQNALRWVREYRFDGLRLDAVHAVRDDSRRHILAEVARAVHSFNPHALVIAEDARNLAFLVQPETEGGWGLDAVWADDFHHQMRRALAGDSESYFRHFDGSMRGIAQTAKLGWFRMGSDPRGLAYPRFLYSIQNHDQIGNRAKGDRLHHSISHAAYRAATTLLLMLPQTPLLFMGQEWAATTPFLFFTDHHEELGRLVTEGRRREFQQFGSFSGEVPDPQSPEMFYSSKLRWQELNQEAHSVTHRLYRDLLALRRRHLSLRDPGCSPHLTIEASGEEAILLRRGLLLIAVALRGAAEIDLPASCGELILSTEDSAYAVDPQPPVYRQGSNQLCFRRAGAAILECRSAEDQA
ncbi:MAG: malto-oligosyltrehalose trehalohydrolase [Acidobacteria bacterium]|nr:malto-oligosyltrehalose trehalohydrolase [Acidobacteriota bacterium]